MDKFSVQDLIDEERGCLSKQSNREISKQLEHDSIQAAALTTMLDAKQQSTTSLPKTVKSLFSCHSSDRIYKTVSSMK